MKKVVISGAKGFVGTSLIKSLNYDYIPYLRFKDSDLKEADLLVHLAGKAHDQGASWMDFKEGNIKLTQKVIEDCKKNNIKKIIFMSSSKVYGEVSRLSLRESDKLDPKTEYGKSKLIAEELIINSGLNYIIFRPPLIISKNAKGNIESLIKISKKGIPLPNNIVNHRSFAELNYVCDSINKAIDDKLPWNEIYNLSNLNFSTSDLFRYLELTPLIFYPKFLFNFFPKKLQEKLLSDFLLDSGKIRKYL